MKTIPYIKIFSLLVLFISSNVSLSQSPTLEWAKSYGGNLSDGSMNIAVDLQGNSYISGYFSDSVDFDPGPGVDIRGSEGILDIYILKLDANGDFVWVYTLGASSIDSGVSISVDENGNVYTTGSFENTIDFDSGLGTDIHTSNGDYDIFVLKLNSNGEFIWAKTLGDSGKEAGYYLTINSTENIIITGFFTGSVDFDPGPGITNLSANGTRDVFTLVLDSLGNLIWVNAFGGPLDDYGYEVESDSIGNIYTIGYFRDTVDFDPGSGITELSSAGGYDIFIQKVDSLGNLIWTRSFGGPLDDYGYSLTVDNHGNIYTCGSFEDTVDFDPSIDTLDLFSNGQEDIFIQKLDSSGLLKWAHAIGGTDFDKAYSITSDNNGDIYLAGVFNDLVDFDPNSGTSYINSYGPFDIFLEKLDSSGNYIWAKPIRGADGQLYSIITIDEFDNIYMTGSYTGTTDFDPQSGTWTETSNGGRDCFALKLSQCSTAPPTPSLSSLPTLSDECEIDQLITPTALVFCPIDTVFGVSNVSLPITTAGTTIITWEFDDGFGNTSTQTQDVIITPLDSTVIQSGITLTANANGVSYIWYDCSTNFGIANETNQSFTPVQNGSYKVRLDNGSCYVFSECITISSVGIENIILNNITSIYPNPSSGLFNMNFENFDAPIEITILDIYGKKIASYKSAANQQFDFSITESKGVYMVKVKSGDYSSILKIVKD